jgi:uncharacterized protein
VTGTVIYLHGFASGPGSKKARFFAGQFRHHGIDLAIPDLAAGDFAHLTVSGQLRAIEQACAGSEVRLMMGSSLGGYLASLYAAAHPQQVERVVMMAPAFDFAARWRERLGEEAFKQWEQSGELPVYHYGAGGAAQVGFELYTDALDHAPFPEVKQPALIFHGLRDEVVPAELSKRFAAERPGAQLRLFDSDHELLDVTGEMWRDTWAFFQG